MVEYIHVEIKNVCQCAMCEAEIAADRSYAVTHRAITEGRVTRPRTIEACPRRLG